MKPTFIAAVAALGLVACAQVTDVTRATVHPVVDRYCAEIPPELRQSARLSLGTTEAGNAVSVDCAGDDPKMPAAGA